MSSIQNNDTICAISTPIGEGGISIVRLSGSDAIALTETVFRIPSGKKLSTVSSHTVHYGHIIDGEEIIDEVMATVFKAPRSYTTEDMVEINTHGGIIVTKKVLELFLAHGARLAEPGEFTKRAFLNGRIDLIRAEAVLDIISAKAERSAHAAVKQLQGQLSDTINVLKEKLISMCAHVESFIDFAEEDIELYSDMALHNECATIIHTIKLMLASYERGTILRDGVHTVIVGKPNVGKSSLLNTLLNRDRALVSEYPGTTRDALEELIEIDGILFRLVDTAGIMVSPQHELDYLSVEKTRQHYEQGDVILFIVDGSQPLDDEDRDIFEKIKDKKHLIIINKNDLAAKASRETLGTWCGSDAHILSVSVKTKEGIASLEKALMNAVWYGDDMREESLIMHVRQKNALEKALTHLTTVHTSLINKEPIELIACDMRDGVQSLRVLTGDICADDVLDVIFSEFCVGK